MKKLNEIDYNHENKINGLKLAVKRDHRQLKLHRAQLREAKRRAKLNRRFESKRALINDLDNQIKQLA